MPSERMTRSTSFQEPLENGPGSRKRARNGSAVSEPSGNSAVESTTTQHTPERVITFKDEEQNCMEVEVEDTDYVDSPPQAIDLGSTSAGQQSNSEVSTENEKYYEGCLVMGRAENWPQWPGMIRKPKGNNPRNKYICDKDGKFYVQFFDEPTSWKRLPTGNLKVFDAGVESETLDDPDPDVVERYAKGIKIAKAASKFTVKDRLRKFTLRIGKSIGHLLTEIEFERIIQNIVKTPQSPQPCASQNDAIAQDRDADASITPGNKQNSTVSFAKVKQRMLDTRQKLRETKEANKGLTAENSKLDEQIDDLEATVRELKGRLKSNSALSTKISTLEQNLKLKDSEMKAQAKEILDLRANLEKERQEKRDCHEELEKIRSEVQALEELSDDE